MDRAEAIIGERLTFFQLIQRYQIQIPIIQRDYAQGRTTVREIRDTFLDALYTYLYDNRKHRDLDFVYGNQLHDIADGDLTFIPLDGQQRLTTLFLLHWFLAVKDNQLDVLREHLVHTSPSNNRKSKFTYETRVSSREFCNSLIMANLDLGLLLDPDVDKNNELSKTIRDQNWYFLGWDTDPTIQSMLVMLDAIHHVFKETTGFFDRLVNENNPVITFQFLDLKEFNLTDDLYIKMNARGIPLSTYENFKARFEQYLEKSNFNSADHQGYELTFDGVSKLVDVKTYFSHRMDGAWANLFWNYTGEDKGKFDELIMNFIRAVLTNHYAVNSSEFAFLKDYLVNKEIDEISFQDYFKHGCLNEKAVIDLITILDLITDENFKVKQYLDEPCQYDERQLFVTISRNEFESAGYVARIKFYAYCQYLIQWKDGTGFSDKAGLKRWMRVVCNLVENTAPYNNEKEFSASLRGIANLVGYSNDVLNYLISSTGGLSGFDGTQYTEEIIKAHLILEQTQWDELIFPVERHGYFKGQIGFLIYLSGIKEYFDQSSHCKWSKQEDDEFKSKFRWYRDIALRIFNENGLNKVPNYLWERALLAKGDYLIGEGSNQSFLVDSDRDISWKRLLKRDKDPSRHSEIIAAIFNEITDADDISTSLEEIKNSYTGDDWRKRFIQIPELFDELGSKRYIRKNSKHGFALLYGERMSGKHAELYSLSFYLNELKGKAFLPFTNVSYYRAIGDSIEDRPCAFLDGWWFDDCHYALDIKTNDLCVALEGIYRPTFKLEFFYREQGRYGQELNALLNSHGFDAIDGRYETVLEEPKLLGKIVEFCESLKTL